MSFDKLRNCPRCGDLFVYTIKEICPKCVKKVEEEYQLCAQFLRRKENRSSTITEMSEKTGVSMEQIYEFVRQKRLMVDQNPNIGYPCEGCGNLIRVGRLCEACSGQWKKTLEASEEEQRPQDSAKIGGYYIQNHSKK